MLLSKSSVKKLVQSLAGFFQFHHLEVSLYFVTEKKICELHAQFFNDPSTTDCISFPVDEEHLGEIFICPKTALLYAAKHRLDPYDETALYIIHGILHCLGYDDLKPAEKKTMRKMEKRCMAHLKSESISLAP